MRARSVAAIALLVAAMTSASVAFWAESTAEAPAVLGIFVDEWLETPLAPTPTAWTAVRASRRIVAAEWGRSPFLTAADAAVVPHRMAYVTSANVDPNAAPGSATEPRATALVRVGDDLVTIFDTDVMTHERQRSGTATRASGLLFGTGGTEWRVEVAVREDAGAPETKSVRAH